MLADQLDYVVGVDPHRDSHALAVVDVVSGAVVFEAIIWRRRAHLATFVDFVRAADGVFDEVRRRPVFVLRGAWIMADDLHFRSTRSEEA